MRAALYARVSTVDKRQDHATTSGHVWAERYDGSLADVFALQDRVTGRIVDALAISLTARERQARERVETAVPQAYDAFLKGWEHFQEANA